MTRYLVYGGLLAMVLGSTMAQAETNAQAQERLQIRKENMLRSQAQIPQGSKAGCDGIASQSKRDQCLSQAQNKNASPLLPVELREYDQFQRHRP